MASSADLPRRAVAETLGTALLQSLMTLFAFLPMVSGAQKNLAPAVSTRHKLDGPPKEFIYDRLAHPLHFWVNDVGMVFFFALAAKEVFEATLPGGPLEAHEDLAASARNTLDRTTGLTTNYLEQLYSFGEIDRFARAEPLDVGKRPAILFLGRIERRKGLEVLIQAMTRLRDLAARGVQRVARQAVLEHLAVCREPEHRLDQLLVVAGVVGHHDHRWLVKALDQQAPVVTARYI